MRRLPPEPQVGDRVTAELVRELIRCIRERQLLKGPNYTLQTGPNGTILKLEPTQAPGSSKQALPWSFICSISEKEGEEVRTGGWTNCRMQIGMAIDWHSPDLSGNPSDTYHVIGGTDLCDDGDHYLEVTLANGDYDPSNDIDRRDDAAEIKVAGEGETVPASDYVGGIIRIPLGTVVEGKIGQTPHFNPVVYKFL